MIDCYSVAFGVATPGCGLSGACWVNLAAPTEEEIRQVAGTFSIPQDFLTDPLDLDERARIESGLAALFDEVGAVGDALVDVPYVTHAYRAVRA